MHRLIPVAAANMGYKVTEIVQHHPQTWKIKIRWNVYGRHGCDNRNLSDPIRSAPGQHV